MSNRLRALDVDVELPQDWTEFDPNDFDEDASSGYVRVHMAGLPAALETLEVGETVQGSYYCTLLDPARHSAAGV